MKTIPAIIASIIITAIIGSGMLFIGANALFNPNAGPIANSPQQAQAAKATSTTTSTSATGQNLTPQQQIAQMQSLINQYQAREKQYQTELNQAAQKINQDNAQLSQANQAVQGYQQVLSQLQQMGLISVSNSGQITVNSFGRSSRSSGFFGDDR